MNPAAQTRFLFIHVMKTGGSSFADLVRNNFPPQARYPDVVLTPDSDWARRFEAYTFPRRIVDDVNARSERLRMVRGHFPYAVRSLLEADYEAMTILRHPVERTVSYLKHCRMYHAEHRELSFEAVYEQPWFFESFMHNYQTKIFSMTPQECLSEERLGDMTPPLPPRSAFIEGQDPPEEATRLSRVSPSRLTLELFSPSTGVVHVDEERLQTARRNLEEISLLGVTERYGNFVEALHTRYGWSVASIPHRNAGDHARIDPGLRKRIEEDNPLDMALYEFAEGLAA